MKLFMLSSVLAIFMFACTTQQVLQTIGGLAGVPTTKEEVAEALKEALVQGISRGAKDASAQGGFANNPLLKIPFPADAQKAEKTLRDIGLGKDVDRFINTLNAGAEEAAKGAAPIFTAAIQEMSFADAWGILKGGQGAATAYLRKTTTDKLLESFKPVMANALNQVNATKFYGELVGKYNQIPLVQKVNPDLNDFASRKAVEGLFSLVEKEENNIRQNLVARTTDLMKKVFAQQQ